MALLLLQAFRWPPVSMRVSADSLQDVNKVIHTNCGIERATARSGAPGGSPSPPTPGRQEVPWRHRPAPCRRRRPCPQARHSLGCTHQWCTDEKIQWPEDRQETSSNELAKSLIYMGIHGLPFWQAIYRKHGLARPSGLHTVDINKVIHRIFEFPEKTSTNQTLAKETGEISGHLPSAPPAQGGRQHPLDGPRPLHLCTQNVMRRSKNQASPPSTENPLKNLQIIDSYGFFDPAVLTGILLRPSIHAAPRRVKTGCQQSYPQIRGMTWKAESTQALSSETARAHEEPGTPDPCPQAGRRPGGFA